MALCDSPCFQVDMACNIEEDIVMDAGLTPTTEFKIMAEDAFGAVIITDDPITTAADGTLTIPLDFLDAWIDLGAQISLTILDADNNAVELVFPSIPVPLPGEEPLPAITCILLIFQTDGATTID